jgi:hypothetical protein
MRRARKGARLGAKREGIVRQFVGPIFGQNGVGGVLTLMGAALLLMSLSSDGSVSN